MTDRELMQQALEALEYASDQTKPEGLHGCECLICKAIPALRDRLAQSEQGPVAWYHAEEYKTHFTTEPAHDLIGKYWQPLYTAPRPWVGLTDEEIRSLNNWWPSYNDKRSLMVLIRDAESKLKE